jgi:serine/threonine protein kinase/WD40 repeat protein
MTHPDFLVSNSRDETMAQVCGEISERLCAGQDVDISVYVTRWPQFGDELRRLFSAMKALRNLADGEPSRWNGQRDPFIAEPLGDFRIIRQIGRGGMGIVYEAEQLSLGRRVALKILPFVTALDQRQLQRFKNEARAAATLDHPQIVPILAVGEERGVHFYAMRLIEGQNLAEFLNQTRSCDAEQPTCPDSIQEYFRQVVRWGVAAAEALDHAHQLGIVHRDIKPSNLLVNTEGKLWVTDFGLATTSADADLTRTGDIIGTLRYMSPEQIRGQRSVIDQRTDIYSLGITLYELLSRQPAFASTDRVELQRQIEQDDPSRASLRTLAVPTEIELIVFKAVDKDPVRRYLTAQEFADDLRRFLNDKPILARQPSTTDRIVKWSRRHHRLVRGLLLTGGVSLISAIVATGFVLNAWRQTELERLARQSERQAAESAHQSLRLHQYVSQVNLADRAQRRGEFDEARHLLDHSRSVTTTTDLKGFEWDYLANLNNHRFDKVGQHKGPAYVVRGSDDGKLMISSGVDGLNIWETEDNQVLHQLQSNVGEVSVVGISPDGRFVVTNTDESTVAVRDIKTLSDIARLTHTGHASGGKFTRSGRYLLTADQANKPTGVDPALEHLIRIWDTKSWTEAMTLYGHHDRLTAGKPSDDDKLLVTADRQGVINLWQMSDGSLTHTFLHNPDAPQWMRSVEDLDLAHHHSWIATVGVRALHLWDIENRSIMSRYPTIHGRIRCVAFSPDDSLLVTGGDEAGLSRGAVQIWRLSAAGTYENRTVMKFPRAVWSLCFLGPRELVIAVEDGSVIRWQLPADEDRRYVAEIPDSVSHAAISPDGRWLARSCPQIVIESLTDFKQSNVLDPGPLSNIPVTFSPDGKVLVAADAGRLRCWRTDGWELVADLQSNSASERLAAIQTVFADPFMAEAVIHRVHRWRSLKDQVPALEVEEIPAPAVFLLRSNGKIKEKKPLIWGMTTPDREVWETHFARVSALELSNDEEWVALAVDDGSIQILESATGTSVALCVGGGIPVELMAFSGDNRTLATTTTGADGEITLWHTRTGRELLTIHTQLRRITSLAFSLEGHWLVIAGQGISGSGEVALLRGKINR